MFAAEGRGALAEGALLVAGRTGAVLVAGLT